MSKNLNFVRNRPFRARRERTFWHKLVDYLFAACLLLALILLVARLDETRSTTYSGTPVINDGDSLTIGDTRIRLWGIDAPELHQSCTIDGKAYACGRMAQDALRAMVRGAKIDCRGADTDQYDRLLAVCTAGSVELNGAMVDAGWALAYGGYESAQANARAAKKGLWAGEFERPRDWRRNPGHTAKPTDDFLAGIGDAIRKWLSSLIYGA